jgi:glucose-1-phosphate cytidylyltransferase
MKVVLFCGGLGLRMGQDSARTPKPMIRLQGQPIVWHVMSYYAAHGHKDFILCLGYRAETIKDYFLTYNEALANDFVLSQGGKRLELLGTGNEDWRISFIYTGVHASVGERLKAVEPYLEGEDLFLANYSDVLTDAPLPDMVDRLREQDRIGVFLCVRPTYSFHVVSTDDHDVVTRLEGVEQSDVWINGGYFVFRKEIFEYLGEGEDLVGEPFRRLIAQQRLLAYRYKGFWAPMDTLKDKHDLENMLESGVAPWRPARQLNGGGRARESAWLG